MALRSLSLPIIFAALLLFFQVSARELEEKPAADKKDADLNLDHGFPYYRPPCKYKYCGRRCCSEEEFAIFSQTQMDEFNENKQFRFGFGPGYGYGYGYVPKVGYGRVGYGYGRGYGYGYGYGGGCSHRCAHRCCSAQEYAQFVQAGN